MKNKYLKILSIFLILVLALGSFAACGQKGNAKVISGIYSYMQSEGHIDKDESLTDAAFYDPGDSLTDWAMLFAFEAGKEKAGAKDEYLADLEKSVTEAYARDTKLSDFKATEWERIALAVLAAGGDPTSFGKDPSGTPIDLIRDGIFCWDMTGELDWQGSNALIYALLVINSAGAEEPGDATYTEESILEKLLTYQGDDGSFGLAAPGGDVDMTAMALQALACYYGTGREDVDQAVERGLEFLSNQQVKGGYYRFGDGYSCESCAQAILALAALGIDPEKDERFMKAGKSAEDALLSFRNEDGGFGTGFEKDGSLMKSEIETSRQAGCALLALEKLRKTGNGRFYDFDD